MSTAAANTRMAEIRQEAIADADAQVYEDLMKLRDLARARQRNRLLHPRQRATEAAVVAIYDRLLDHMAETGALPTPEEVAW